MDYKGGLCAAKLRTTGLPYPIHRAWVSDETETALQRHLQRIAMVVSKRSLRWSGDIPDRYPGRIFKETHIWLYLMSIQQIFSALHLKLRWFYHEKRVSLFGKTVYRDRFGLRYHLWSDTRLRSSISTGVRTDDTGVLNTIFAVLEKIESPRKSITCLDVGAYIGVMSLAMSSRLRESDKIHAFEPSPISFARLQANIRLNGNVMVTPHQMAISGTAGTARLKLMDDPGTSHLIGEGFSDKGPRGQRLVDVTVTTLDRFAEENSIEHIDLMKVDAEGEDDGVLTGASRLLSSDSIDYLIVEYIEGESASENARRTLQNYGFECYLIVRNGDYLVRSIDHYPVDSYKPALNLLAISAQAPFSGEELGLAIR